MGDIQRPIVSSDWVLIKGRELLHYVASMRDYKCIAICGNSFDMRHARIPINDDEYFLCKKCKAATGDTRLAQDATFEETQAWCKANPEKCL